ncbi:hypothetical protein CYMTET_4488 [Cymbomonas tetramitiformis]|uniref:Protein kinase domain-containing protein n=1 Tax=Cymbomonas tetramitiformis TaxID=36881 RepID=A0AAE0LK03_9CHLO|nr:hypothetical protein CYMTET_4488 [Cymbomonas tetramitiformis]
MPGGPGQACSHPPARPCQVGRDKLVLTLLPGHVRWAGTSLLSSSCPAMPGEPGDCWLILLPGQCSGGPGQACSSSCPAMPGGRDKLALILLPVMPGGWDKLALILLPGHARWAGTSLPASSCPAMPGGPGQACSHPPARPCQVGRDKLALILLPGHAREEGERLRGSLGGDGDKVVGTPHYMPIEQWDTSGHIVDCRADLWAIAVVLYEMLTGTLPYGAGKAGMQVLLDLMKEGPVTDIRENIPPGCHVSHQLAEITMKALQKRVAGVEQDRLDRFYSAKAMRAALQESLVMAGGGFFHVFLSYRVATEARFVEDLHMALRKLRVADEDMSHVQVFWDKVCLKNGQRWEDGFMSGLSHSLVMVPVLSEGSTGPMTDAESVEARVDNVLLEWASSLALFQSPQSNVMSIFPIFMGKNGGSSNFFADGSNGMGRPYPENKPVATLDKVQEHLAAFNLWDSCKQFVENMNVKNTIDELKAMRTYRFAFPFPSLSPLLPFV